VVREQHGELKGTGYEIFIGILSVLSIVNLVLVEVWRDAESLQYVLYAINLLLSLIFFADFTYRLVTAPSRSGYFFRQYGWADLLASFPFPQTKVLRLFRLLRVVRLLRILGPREVFRGLRADLAGSALLVLLLMVILVLEVGSLSVLAIEENAEGANITTASDALWYVIVTISTVGYGDQYPVTSWGRLVGAMIIVIGVGIFGTLAGYLANLFLSSPKPPPPSEDEAARDLVRSELESLKEQLDTQRSALDAIDRALQAEGR
jgi:voltage-gated potassium channel